MTRIRLDQPNYSQLTIPGLEEPNSSCQRCGASFVPTGKAGRPARYCCDECRQLAIADQQTAWRRQRDAKSARSEDLICRVCHQPFQAADATAGRVPAYCGEDCRKRGILAKKLERRSARLTR